ETVLEVERRHGVPEVAGSSPAPASCTAGVAQRDTAVTYATTVVFNSSKGGVSDMSYLKRLARVPQSAPIPGSNQVANSAGGFSWAVDDWARLRRFLILGSEGGSFYAGEWKLTRENATAVERCLDADGPRTVEEIVAVSDAGGAAKNDPAIFALAMAAGAGDEATRKAALAALASVCRTSTHLFQFASFVEGFRGWGRSLRRAVGAWYSARS